MLVVALVDFLLLIGLLCNLLTYEKMGFLFMGMAVLIGLAMIHMQLDEKDTPEKIMEDFYAKQSIYAERIPYNNEGRNQVKAYGKRG